MIAAMASDLAPAVSEKINIRWENIASVAIGDSLALLAPFARSMRETGVNNTHHHQHHHFDIDNNDNNDNHANHYDDYTTYRQGHLDPRHYLLLALQRHLDHNTGKPALHRDNINRPAARALLKRYRCLTFAPLQQRIRRKEFL